MPQDKEFVFFYNPGSGALRHRLADITGAMHSFFPKARFEPTLPDTGDMKEKYSHLCSSGRVFTALGGDGTLNLLVNSFYPAVRDYALIPVGTANVIANELSLPPGISDSIRLLHESRPVRLDLGVADSRYFLLCLGLGMDAGAVHNVNPGLKRKTGKLAYVASFIYTAASFREPLIRVLADGRPYRGYSMIIQNFRNFAGSWHFSEDVSPSDGMLHMVLFRRKRMGLSRLALPRLLLGGSSSSIVILPFREMLIQEQVKTFAEIDGDAVNTVPRVIKVLPKAVNLHVQKGSLIPR